MSTTLTESPGTGIAPPLRPSIWRVGWATFVGYFLTVVVGLIVVIPVAALGIAVFNDPGRGIFLRYDVWSWLAEACVGLLATWFTAFFVSGSIRQRTGWEVPFGFAYVTLLLTGYAPLLALTPLYGATAPVSLGAATLLLRWRAEPSGAEPLKAMGAIPRRHRRKVVIGLAVAGPLMFLYVLGYGATHPLHQNAWSGDDSHGYQPGKLLRYQLDLDNSGPFEVTDLSIVRVEGSPTLQLERVGFEANAWSVPEGKSIRMLPPMSTVDRFELGRGDLTLELRQGRLCPPGVAKIDAVWIRYTVLHRRFEQRIPLQNPPRVRCP